MRTCVTSKIQTLSHRTQLKLRFTAMNLQVIDVDFLHQIWLQTSVYITQRVTATPTLIGTWCYEYYYNLNFTWTTNIHLASFYEWPRYKARVYAIFMSWMQHTRPNKSQYWEVQMLLSIFVKYTWLPGTSTLCDHASLCHALLQLTWGARLHTIKMGRSFSQQKD